MKFVKWFLVVLVTVPIVIVAGAYVRNKAVGPVGWAEDNTIKALKAKMKDPDSMVIRSSFVIQKTNEKNDMEIFICGVVDGKNSFGGYADGTRFASRSVSSKSLGTFDTYTVEMEDWENKATAIEINRLSPFESVYWNDYCVDSTHPPLTASR